MTAKSRRRKLDKKLHCSTPSMQTFQFTHGNHNVSVEAESEEHAKHTFQEHFGYSPTAE